MLDGLFYALLAAVLFGLQYVPVKKYKVYDGTTFQWFMCSGILFVGFIGALIGNDLHHGLPPRVVFGGVLWAISNVLVLPLVKLLGIGLGFSLYHFVNLVVGYLIGRHGIFGVPKMESIFDGSLMICDIGCGLILISFCIMLLVEGQHEKQPKKAAAAQQPPSTLHGKAYEGTSCTNGDAHEDMYPVEGSLLEASGFSVFTLEADVEDEEANAPQADNHQEEAAPSKPTDGHSRMETDGAATQHRQRNVILGVLLAILAGSFTGLQSVPATLYGHEHPEYPSSAIVLPQCAGVWFASTAIYVVYSGIAQLTKNKVPHSVIRPAFLSGCFWAIGFMFMMKGIYVLGFGVGYILDAVGPIMVASIVSICWFKEITGRKQLIVYWSAEALQMLGVIMITCFSKPGA